MVGSFVQLNNTHRKHCCIATATIVTRTRHYVMLYVQYSAYVVSYTYVITRNTLRKTINKLFQLLEAPRFVTVCFVSIQNNDGFEHRRPNIYIISQKCPKINTDCDVQKQHSQSETTAIPIYHLSPSGMRLIKPLKQEPLCPVREVQ